MFVKLCYEELPTLKDHECIPGAAVTSNPGMTAHHEEAIELNVIETVVEDSNMGPPKICIDLSPTLSRQNTADTIDTDFPETPSPRRVFTEFSSGTEASIRNNNQSSNPITDKAFLTPPIQRRGTSILYAITQRIACKVKMDL